MRLIAYLLLLLTPIATNALTPHTAHYQLSINGFKIADEVRTLHKLADHYFYTANAKTSGVAALVKNYTISASSTFVINEQGFDSTNYQIMEQEDNKVVENYAIDINSQNQNVISMLTKTQPKVQTWSAPKSGNMIDPLGLFLAIGYDLGKQKNLSYQVANGKNIETQNYQVLGDQVIQINAQPSKATQVSRLDSQHQMLAYFVDTYQNLPVFIKQQKHGKEYVYELVGVEFAKQGFDKLQVTF